MLLPNIVENFFIMLSLPMELVLLPRNRKLFELLYLADDERGVWAYKTCSKMYLREIRHLP